MCVYGPVASNLSGRTLKVCPVPARTCTCSCVYCHHGATKKARGVRRDFQNRSVVLERILDVCGRSHPDFITFTGGGEPTLDLSLGWLIRETRRLAKVPVAAVTNGTLLYRQDVRQDLARADVVISSLDAGTEELFLDIKRPHGSLDFARVQGGLLRLKEELRGELWLDVMLVRRMNDGPEALKAIRTVIDQVEPDVVRVKVPFRPPAESRALPPSPEALAGAIRLLGPRARKFDAGEEPIECWESSSFNRVIGTICACRPIPLARAREIEGRLRSPGALQRMIEIGDLVPREWQGERFLYAGNEGTKKPPTTTRMGVRDVHHSARH
jgi:wyosine [tRNA(Phe)-imidazoG37] synthetase (radical SAM superfamily)